MKVSTGTNHLLDFEKDWGLGQDVLARVLARGRRITLLTDVRGWLKSLVLGKEISESLGSNQEAL